MTQTLLGEPVRKAVAFECRACPPAPPWGDASRRETPEENPSRSPLTHWTSPLFCHAYVSSLQPSPLGFGVGRLIPRQTPLVAYRGATEISITAFCPETQLLGGGGEGLSQEYYRTTSGSDKPLVTASRDLTRPSPLPTWGWVLSLAAAERAL